ncbi:MAG: putative acetyltransferase [Phycisphaerales bacterium]|nr:putative acetyltransferase [Phycisphaerales bacterium]
MKGRNQDFQNPHSLGNKIGRLVWGWVWVLLFRFTPPRLFGGWRRFLLKLFGAKIGSTWLHPTVRVWAPWMLKAGDHVFIDRNVYLYNVYGIEIADRVVVSFDSTLCTASHDTRDPTFGLTGAPIKIGNDVWVAADVFVGPGVTINDRAVVGARSSVFADLPAGKICVGTPAKPIRDREIDAG